MLDYGRGVGYLSGDLIAWQRWWLPRGDDLTLWQGMLPDPDQGSNRFLNRGRSRLAETSQLRARVLLADPGMGKSTELRGEVDRLRAAGEHVELIDLGAYASTGEVRDAIAEAAQAWRDVGRPGDLVLAIDGFDELLVDIVNLSEVLARSIERLDHNQLCVVVASRGSLWSASLGARFTGGGARTRFARRGHRRRGAPLGGPRHGAPARSRPSHHGGAVIPSHRPAHRPTSSHASSLDAAESAGHGNGLIKTAGPRP